MTDKHIAIPMTKTEVNQFNALGYHLNASNEQVLELLIEYALSKDFKIELDDQKEFRKQARVDEKLAKKFAKHCKRKKISQSEMVRQALKQKYSNLIL